MKLEALNVSMKYPNRKQALKNINLQIESPVMTGILGPNGAGKTTLMKLITAGMLPTEGELRLDDKPLIEQEQLLKTRLGYLPQFFGLFDELTVMQFLDYMAALKGIKGKKNVLDAVELVMSQTNITEQRKTRISNLSGGMRQRVGIAQALLGNPDLIILDEPTVGLDPEERITFRNLFSEISQNKIVLLSTHIVEDIQSICNLVLVIANGQILFSGKPTELISLSIGHVGTFTLYANEKCPDRFKVVSRVNTFDGIKYRVVGKELPNFAEVVEPTLEDAYLYVLTGKTK